MPSTRTIPNKGLLRYLGISNIELVLKGVLQTKDYILAKLLRVTNDFGNILGKKGLPFAEGGVQDAEEGAVAGFFGSIY